MAGEEAVPKRPLVVAHRGFSRVAPENTVAAAKKAIEIGADGSEFDVYPTSDGALVVIHDSTVDRTTNGKGRATELTLAQIRSLDAGSWKAPCFANERIPTMEEMLSAMKETACQPVIEIKGKDIADKVVAAVRAAGMVDHVFIISFNADNVRCAKTLEPRLRCALLSETKKMPKDLSRDEQVAWLVKAAADCKTDFVDLDYKMLTKDMVEKLHQSGLTVWVWTVDEPEAMDDMIAWGIDGITTNCPDVLRSRVDHAGKAN